MTLSPSLQIRTATLADLDLLTPLFDAYRMFYRYPSDLNTARTFLQARLQQQQALILLAEQDGAALGFTLIYPSFCSLAAAPLWILNDLLVLPQARRHGVARALLQAAQAQARAAGVARITLQTAHDNLQAQALYTQLGFVRDAVFYNYDFTLPA